ncbi:MAG: type II toxin-antitoxin system RelE/ParE family toxin [Gallicola sp.]|nr:type II toxin-antitoxin system RelE/ParE family toxin [Gallicola sp.]
MYHVKISEGAINQLRKLDPSVRWIVQNWILKNLSDTSDPRVHGKALTGNLKGIWRYRVGDYRLFAEIIDQELLIFIFEFAHRRWFMTIKP